MYSSSEGTNSQRDYGLMAGLVLLALGLSLTVTQPVLAAGTWSPTGPLNVRRSDHTATLLQDGTVLVAGGYNDVLWNYIDSVERYYPGTGIWSHVSSLKLAREKHIATRLEDGRVLVAGGWGNAPPFYLAHAEIYNPGSDIWTVIDPMGTIRARGHTATRLEDGRVLVTGGRTKTTVEFTLDTAEIFDPADGGSWTPVATPMAAPREAHTATMLNDGRVLVAGGYDSGANSYTANAQIFNPADNTWTTDTASLNGTRANHTATRLADGKVLVVGGSSATQGLLDTAEVYDPVLNCWTPTANDLAIIRNQHTATLLADGRVLVAGGTGEYVSYNDVVELYNPATKTWSLDTPLGTARSVHTATLLNDGRVLVAGGRGSIFFLDSAEL